jgi:hypothetical protein
MLNRTAIPALAAILAACTIPVCPAEAYAEAQLHAQAQASQSSEAIEGDAGGADDAGEAGGAGDGGSETQPAHGGDASESGDGQSQQDADGNDGSADGETQGAPDGSRQDGGSADTADQDKAEKQEQVPDAGEYKTDDSQEQQVFDEETIRNIIAESAPQTYQPVQQQQQQPEPEPQQESQQASQPVQTIIYRDREKDDSGLVLMFSVALAVTGIAAVLAVAFVYERTKRKAREGAFDAYDGAYDGDRTGSGAASPAYMPQQTRLDPVAVDDIGMTSAGEIVVPDYSTQPLPVEDLDGLDGPYGADGRDINEIVREIAGDREIDEEWMSAVKMSLRSLDSVPA